MNEILDEDASVIARLRSALDEVTAESDGMVAVEARMPKVSAARWMAVAAAVVLIAGAVTAIAINRRNAPEVTTVPTDVATTTVTEPVLIRSKSPWFRLVAADLVPGERTHEQLGQEGPKLAMAWFRSEDSAYLTMTAWPESSAVDFADDATRRVLNDAPLLFSSYGLTDGEREALADQVEMGSGLPYLLPVEGWEMTALGNTAGESRLVQMYTALNTDPLSSYMPSVTMSVGEYRGELASLATWPDPKPITVAGYEGWKVTEGDGTVSAFWDVGDGNWATLRIDAKLADRADALIAGVIQVTEAAANQPTVDTVLAPTEPTSDVSIAGDALPPFSGSASNDPAVGMPAPSVTGFDYQGNEIRIDPAKGPLLVMFQAHWCPHCTANLVNVMDWKSDGTIPSWLPVVLVSTAESPTRANYPASQWLEESGWAPVLRDSNEGDGVAGQIATAYGAGGWPFFVVIGVDGQVLARATGDLTSEQMKSLLDGLPKGPPAVVGRLKIPKLDLDWLVVDKSLGLSGSSEIGPVFVGGALPTELPIGEDVDVYSMIYGNRTTHGAPFLDLDQLVVGDTFTWTDESGTATFEVISTNSCPADEGCPGIAGALVLTTPDPAFTDQAALYVFARRTA